MREDIVAIVGRPNVGKSTLFNRLAGFRQAVVSPEPGTTRDRLFAPVTYEGREFLLIDTGGFIPGEKHRLASAITRQIERAITDASIVLLVVDAKTGLTPVDEEIAQELRSLGKEGILLVNKCDTRAHDLSASEFFSLGLGDPIPISAIHGRGIELVLQQIARKLPEALAVSHPEMCLAIVGRPNVGKSSLLNLIIGDERALVDESPGTTRDALDSHLDFNGMSVVLIDTAGIKRPSRQGTGIGYYSLLRTENAIRRADVAALVMDVTELLTAQDKHIARRISEEGKGIIVVVNKWDITTFSDKASLTAHIRGCLNFLPPAPIVYTSAKTGYGVGQVVPAALGVFQERKRRLSTSEVNSFLKEATANYPPPERSGKQPKIFYATQAEVNPPTFIFFCSYPELIHFSYRRYLENQLRERFGFYGTPIQLRFRARG